MKWLQQQHLQKKNDYHIINHVIESESDILRELSSVSRYYIQ